MEKQKKSFRKWAKKNKKLIIGVSSAVGIGILVLLIAKNKDDALSSSEFVIPEENKVQSVLSRINDFLEDVQLLQGETYLPTELGQMASVSGQKINQLLVEDGLQVRVSPNDPRYGYRLTELGEKFGKYTPKGDYKNIEWDINVLRVIFPDEVFQRIVSHLDTQSETD